MKLENLKTNDYIVSIDMDGVVADFDRSIQELFGHAPPTDVAEKEAMFEKIHEMVRTGTPFFYNLEPMPDAMKLWSFIKANVPMENINFLTATGKGMLEEVGDQKIKWIRKHIHPTVKVMPVERSIFKAHHVAHDKHILIDDRNKSLDPWTEAGGIPILHTSADDTIKKLKEIMSESVD